MPSLAASFQKGGTNAVWGRRHPMDPHANGVVDRIQDRRRGRNHCLLPDPLGTERPDGRGILNQNRFDRRQISAEGIR